MNFSLGRKGGIQDPQILRLLSELIPIVKKHGAKGEETIKFIEKHAGIIAVDEHSKQMLTFKEIAESLAPLIQGFRCEPRKLPGDLWKSGSVEDMFNNKNPDEPADFWKNK